jgi:hypothetical protein
MEPSFWVHVLERVFYYSGPATYGFRQVEMVEAFHDIALESGAKVIFGVGLDATPCDPFRGVRQGGGVAPVLGSRQKIHEV